MQEGKLVRDLYGHVQRVVGIAVERDFFVSVSDDSLRVWDRTTGECRHMVPCVTRVREQGVSFPFSPLHCFGNGLVGASFVTGGQRVFRVLDLRSGKVLQQVSMPQQARYMVAGENCFAFIDGDSRVDPGGSLELALLY